MIELMHAWLFPAARWTGSRSYATALGMGSHAPSEHRSGASRSLIKLIALAEKDGASIVGLTSVLPCEATAAAAELAASYGLAGRRALLADVSEPVTSEDCEGGSPVMVTDGPGLVPADPAIAALVLAALEETTELDGIDGARKRLADATKDFDAVIVSLPPIVQADGMPAPVFMRTAPLCDMVFILCLSGVTKHASLAEATEISRVSRAKVAGIVLCDWELAGHSLLQET